MLPEFFIFEKITWWLQRSIGRLHRQALKIRFTFNFFVTERWFFIHAAFNVILLHYFTIRNIFESKDKSTFCWLKILLENFHD